MSELLFQTNYSLGVNSNLLMDQARTLKMYKAKNPAISFFTTRSIHFNGSNKAFNSGEYDLYETGRIIDTESLVMRAFNKKNTLVFRDGYEIKSKNKENLKYIKRRLSEISFVSKKKFDDILKEFAYNLISFHNPYLVKVRKEEASSGEVRIDRGKKNLKPVAAYFCLAPETMEKKLNDSGDATRYRQYVGNNGDWREFAEHNIIYTPFNKRTGFTMGTPPLESVKEDILALRRIEESVETLIYKSLFPIIHLKVGTDKVPAKTLPNGVSEVDSAKAVLENIDDNGGIVTSERIDISAIGAESLALRVETYLEYFKKRVYAGLGMANIDFGDGDSTGRNTGEVLSSSLKDSVIGYQDILSQMVTNDIFIELLLESGKYKYPFEITEEDLVYLEFNTVDTDEKIKVENHSLNKAAQGVLTTDELREELGMPPMEGGLKKSFSIELSEESNRQAMELASHTAKIAPKVSASAGSPSGNKETKKTKSGNTKTKNSKKGGASNTSKSITSPKNQHSDSERLSTYLSDYAYRIDDVDLILRKTKRELTDYLMLKVSSNLIDGTDFVPREVSILISNNLIELLDFITEKSRSIKDLQVKFKKTIDKLVRSVNNTHMEFKNE